MKTGFLVIVALVALLSVVLGFMVVTQIIGKDKADSGSSGALIGVLAVGTVAALPKLKIGRVAKAKVSKAKRETIIVYENPQPWRVSLPIDEIIPRLDLSARREPDSTIAQYIGAGLGALVGGVILFGLFAFLFHSVLVAAILGTPVAGLVIGGIVGYIIGPRFGPQPYWVVKRLASEANPAIWNILPIPHTKLLMDYWTAYSEANLETRLREAAKRYLAERKVDPAPELVAATVKQMKSAELMARAVRAYRADQFQAVNEAKDREAVFTTVNPRWRKLAFAAICVVLVCVLGLLILFGIAIAGK